MGAALGGLLFGWLGDYIGRAKTMGLAILTYSVLTGAAYYAQTIEQLLALRFFACLGVGGMWPVGVALSSEAWPNAWRPLLAGLIGTAANVGLVIIGLIGSSKGISPDNWRWVMVAGGTPVILGLFVLLFVPESPTWLLHRARAKETKTGVPMSTVFRPPYLAVTILGIVLGTIPLLGGWGSVNWLIPWADKVGARLGDPGLSSTTQTLRSAGAAIGSLMGGYLASMFGRRSTYFAVSLLSLLSSGYIFWFLTPESPGFFVWTFVLGFAATIYFGWLPLYLPELFPTKVRATGSGVTFNFGRILSAVGVLGAGWLLGIFEGDYAHTGRVTHLIFAIGMIVILFAPDTSQRRMDE
jgi:MFS family permease